MAITLTVRLSDSEQAKLTEILATTNPGLVGVAAKEWAEATMKAALRAEVIGLRQVDQREKDNAANRQRETADRDAWAVPTPPTPPDTLNGPTPPSPAP